MFKVHIAQGLVWNQWVKHSPLLRIWFGREYALLWVCQNSEFYSEKWKFWQNFGRNFEQKYCQMEPLGWVEPAMWDRRSNFIVLDMTSIWQQNAWWGRGVYYNIYKPLACFQLETKAGLCVSSSEDTIGGRKQRCLREDARWAKEEPSQVFNYWMAQEAWMCNHLHLQVGQIEEPCPSELRSSWQLRIEASVQLLIGSTKDWMYNYSRRGWERPTQGSKPNKGVTRGSTPEPERLGWKEIWRHLQGFEQLLLDIARLLNCE